MKNVQKRKLDISISVIENRSAPIANTDDRNLPAACCCCCCCSCCFAAGTGGNNGGDPTGVPLNDVVGS
ncbi:hypothetical protein FUAX_47310 (plasmid) [Fulvitalea axinellae]|uniref:Uncharacterized protein n=1 Tax=Fulvitalea axinellae TaxID=1182444 RepID=A0AAU9CJK5_9BACT|nr:hypothetical protein FUAX_47310 [Fulvitalea axinellae]